MTPKKEQTTTISIRLPAAHKSALIATHRATYPKHGLTLNKWYARQLARLLPKGAA